MTYKIIIEGSVWEFESSSSNRKYTVKLNGNVNNRERNGLLSCNCPAWIYNTKGNRTCKHTEEILRKELVVTKQLDIHDRKKILYGG